MSIRVTIKQEGGLMPVLLNAEITPAQVSMIRMIAGNPDFTYSELLIALRKHDYEAERRADYDAPIGAGESVEAFRG